MPRHVARYFMERRHHRRRIPTASRYISGCTVNPSGPAVRQLHRGRSPEFREWSPSPLPYSSPPLVFTIRVRGYVRVCTNICIVVPSPRCCGWSPSCECPTTIAGPWTRTTTVGGSGAVASFPSWVLSAFHGQGPWLLPAPSTVFARRLGRRWIVSRSRERSSFTWYHCALYFNFFFYCCRYKYI